MAVYLIKVSLALNGGQRTLVPTPTYCEVDLEREGPSRIVWVLDDGGSDAHFVLDAGKKGIVFDWDDKPGKNIFGKVDVDTNGKIISIQDNHFKKGKFGQWRYRLTVRQGKKLYKLPPDDSGPHKTESDGEDRGKNPVIINR